MLRINSLAHDRCGSNFKSMLQIEFISTTCELALKWLTLRPHWLWGIVSGNGLSPVGRQAVTLTNAGLLSIGPLGTNFSEIWIKMQNFSFMKMHSKMSFAKWRPFCLGLNVLSHPRCGLLTLRLEYNGWHFAEDLFKSIFLYEKFCILIEIKLKLSL